MATESKPESVYFKLLLEGLQDFKSGKIPTSSDFLNPGLKHMLGYSDEALPNTEASWRKILHDEDSEVLHKSFKEHVASEGKRPFDLEMRCWHVEGHIVYVWCRGMVIEWNEAQEPLRMVGSFMDISELKTAKEKLARTIQTQELIINGIDAGVWDWDIPKNSNWWSDRLYELLHYRKDELEVDFNTFVDLVHPDDAHKVDAGIQDHLKYKLPYKVEFRMLCGDKRYRWFESSGKALRDAEGNPVRMAGSLVDIDQRKQVEQKVRMSEELMRLAGNLAKVGGWELYLEDMKPLWSEEVFRIHEVPMGQLPDLEEAMSFYPEKDRAILNELIEKAIEKGEGYDRELNFITAKNNHRLVRVICKPIQNELGKVIGLQGVFQDVTEKKSQETTLRESLDILDEQNKRLLNFAQIVSHNLNSHVGNIKMLTNLLQQTDDKDERATFTSMMSEAGQNLEETIYQLNEIVKIQNSINKSRQFQEFNKVLRGVKRSISGELRAKNAKISTDFQVEGVDYVPAYLESIFLNFITNSIKYRHPDRKPEVHISSYKQGEQTVLSFRDNGLGINLERHGEKLFGMYKTFHKKADSKGIGLFITKNQVEAMGGTIEVESEVNVGTTFRVIF